MLTLPTIDRATLTPPAIDWATRPRRFMNPGELEVLCALINTVRPRSVLEFGVNVGRTAQAILEYCPGIEYYAGVDVPQGYVPAMAVQRGEVPTVPGEMVYGDSRFDLILRPRGSHDLTPADLAPCDAVFIDGDHSRAGVLQDTALARAVVRRGGVIIWHDYHDLGTVDVRDVLHEFAAAGEAITSVAGTWIAFQRV